MIGIIHHFTEISRDYLQDKKAEQDIHSIHMYIHSIHMYTQLIALYVMSTPLKSQICQDRDQLYKKVQEGLYGDVQAMNWFMSVYISIIL